MEYYDNHSFCNSLLKPGEMIRWRGKPQRGHLFRKDEMPVLLVLIGAVSFILVNTIPFLAFLRTDAVNAVGYICSALSVLYLLLKFTVRPYLRKRTLYVITNRRVIAKQVQKIRTMDLADPLPIFTEFYRNGCGTISFGQRGIGPVQPGGKSKGYAALTGCLALENIPNAEYVYELVCDINYALNFGVEE